MQWSKYFDAIYCVHFLPNTNRREKLEPELDKVGIRTSGIFKYKFTFLTPYTYYINFNMPLEAYHLDRYDGINRYTNGTLAIYSIFNESILRGYRHILVIEDDLVVLKDQDDFAKTLDHLPSDWDFIQFDRIPAKHREQYLADMTSINDYIATYTGGYWGKVMTGYSNNAMLWCKNAIEKELYCADGIIDNNPDPKLSILKRYITKQILCVQRDRNTEYEHGC